MKKAEKWFRSFISNWEECRDLGITGASYASNLMELYNLCSADMGKSWAKRVYRKSLKEWERKKKQ